MNQSTGFQFHVNPSKEELIELVREMVELTIVLVKLSERFIFHLGNCPPTPPLTQY